MCVCVFFLGFIILDVFTVKPQAIDTAPVGSGSSFNQILGIRGAKQETVSRHSAMSVYFSKFTVD